MVSPPQFTFYTPGTELSLTAASDTKTNTQAPKHGQQDAIDFSNFSSIKPLTSPLYPLNLFLLFLEHVGLLGGPSLPPFSLTLGSLRAVFFFFKDVSLITWLIPHAP